MRSSFLAVALGFSALSAGNPLPQDINLDAVIAAPDPTYTIAVGATGQVVPLNTAAAVQSADSVTSVTVQSVEAAETGVARLAKRTTVTCAPQPAGATGAPTYSPSAASDFAAATAFGAKASGAPTPPGYDRTFVNLAASNNAYGYMGFTTLQDYDTVTCAAKCTAMAGCSAVNIYYERDPSLDPGASCPDPAPVTMIKCVFWGGPVSAANALNAGQPRTNFQVKIAGSNGYVSQKIATPPGYTLTSVLGTSAINAPYDSQGYNTYMGFKIFTQGGFSVQYCADYCTSQNAYNMAYPPNDGSPVQLCQFFDTYILYKNTQSQVQGQYCAIYSEPWASSYATNNGQYSGSDFYGIYSSYTYTNSTGVVAPNKNGAVHQASKDIVYSSLQTYCLTLLGYQTPLATATATITATTTPTTSTTATFTISSTVTVTAVAKRSDSGATPDVLTKYPVGVRSSACSLLVTSPTVTSTTTITTTTLTATADPVVVISTASVSAISTVTVSPPAAQTNCAGTIGSYITPNGNQFAVNCGAQYLTASPMDQGGAGNHHLYSYQADFATCVRLCSTTSGCIKVNYYTDGTQCVLLSSGSDLAGGYSKDDSASLVTS